MLEAEVCVYTWNDSIDTLIQDFANGRMLTVSDGSHSPRNKAGSAALYSRIKRRHRRIYQRWRTYPRTTGCTRSISKRARRITRNYYHSQVIVRILEQMVPDSQGVVVIGCDGLSALMRSLWHRPRTAVHKLQTFRHHCSNNGILERNEIHHFPHSRERTPRW